MKQTFLLSHTPTTEHRIVLEGQTAILSTTTRFALGASDTATLVWFLQEVKADRTHRHTFTDENWVLDYDPQNGDLDKFEIMRRATGRIQSMAASTAYKLLDALTGKTERLIQEKREDETDA